MQESISLKSVNPDEETCEIRFTIAKSLLPYFQEILDNFENMAYELRVKARNNEQKRREWFENHRQEVEERDNAILVQIRTAYALEFNRIPVIRHAMKHINKNFKEWIWIRQRFKKEIEAQRDLEIIRLSNLGLNSKEIASKIGLHPGSVRTIMHKSKGGCN